MTAATPTAGEELVLRIREQAHWRTRIEPPTAGRRFGSGLAARDAARAATVRIRGWDFPHLQENSDFGGSSPVPGGWESWFLLQPLEAWRIMESGQFIHYVTLRDDAHAGSWPLGDTPEPSRTMALDGIVLQIAEIMEFASRLAGLSDYRPSMRLTIALNGVRGRRLAAASVRTPPDACAARRDSIRFERTLDAATLAVRRRDHGLDALASVLADFGYEPPGDVLAALQARALERRV